MTSRYIAPEIAGNAAAAHSGQPGSEADWVAVVEDLPVTLALEVGRRQISIRDLLMLTVGSVIELDRAATDAMDVFMNGRRFAQGEVISINGKCGLRLVGSGASRSL